MTLSSSSDKVGASPVTLTVTVDPSTVMLADGGVIIYFPDYYEDSGSDQMIAQNNPSCSGNNLYVSQCDFNTAFRQLSIKYQFDDGENSGSKQTLQIGSFQNPVKPGTKSGFVVLTTDELGYVIGESETISLTGVDEYNDFNYVSFSFDDNGRVGAYSTFRINIGLVGSIGQQCYVKVQFPSDFTLDSQLLSVSGTNFLQQQSGSSHTLLERNTSSRIIEFQACMSTWGAESNGSIIFSRVKNPEYIKETGTFKIYIATDNDFDDLIAQQTSDLKLGVDDF